MMMIQHWLHLLSRFLYIRQHRNLYLWEPMQAVGSETKPPAPNDFENYFGRSSTKINLRMILKQVTNSDKIMLPLRNWIPRSVPGARSTNYDFIRNTSHSFGGPSSHNIQISTTRSLLAYGIMHMERNAWCSLYNYINGPGSHAIPVLFHLTGTCRLLNRA